MMSISISQLKYVIALEKTGSFSDAATECFVTQSTLSTMIRKMEDQLDLKLFDRQQKPIRLTDEGQRLINQIKILDKEYNNLLELFEETKTNFHSTIRIGIIPTLAPFLLPLILDDINQKHPQLILEISEITTKEIVNSLELREIDIGILSIPLKEHHLNEEVLFNEEFIVYDTRSEKHQSKRYKIQDIDLSNLWLLQESHCLTSQIGKICQLKNEWDKVGNIKLMSGSILSLLEMVKLKKGITLLPRLASLNDVVNSKYIYHLERPVPVRAIGMVTLNSFLKKESYEILKDCITRTVNSHFRKLKSTKTIDPF